MVYKCFYKKTSATHERSENLATRAIRNKFGGSDNKKDNKSNIELAEELHKLIIRKFKKRKVNSPFIDYIWGADLADMQIISKLDKVISYLLCYQYFQ